MSFVKKSYLLVAYLILAPFVNHSQSLQDLDTLYSIDSVDISFSENGKGNLIFTYNSKPITGWVYQKETNFIGYIHYLKGMKNGLSIDYRKKKRQFFLSKIKKYADNEIKSEFTFNPPKKKPSNGIYGLNINSFSTWESIYWTNKDIVQRSIVDYKKNKITDYYYYPEGHFKSKINYKSEKDKNELIEISRSININEFPSVLNENKEVFSHIKYDGYYIDSTCLEANCKDFIYYKIQFFKDGTNTFIIQSENYLKMNSITTTKTEYTNPNTIPSNYFKTDSNTYPVIIGEFISSGVYLTVKERKNGAVKKRFFSFQKKKKQDILTPNKNHSK
jgi:hypothetical protein